MALEAGLIVPVVRRADERGVRQIAAAARDLADSARAGTLSPDECAGGTFTITNLGMYGITEFTPLINVPESAILGVGIDRRELPHRGRRRNRVTEGHEPLSDA